MIKTILQHKTEKISEMADDEVIDRIKGIIEKNGIKIDFDKGESFCKKCGLVLD